MTSTLYNTSLFLLTDLYQLTMAYGYWKNGMAERPAVFNLFYRKNPFGGGYALAAGLNYAMDWMKDFKLSAEDAQYLATLNGADGKPLFEQAFIDYLRELKFTCDIDAVPEGTVVFPHEPLIRVRGPLLQGQLLETPLLNIINFQTLIATKASRVKYVAGTDSVMEFGLRRAQGIDGGLAASRAAYIGGVDGTSNVLAGRLFGIPLRGTHAHAWVMAFDSEKEAFQKYAEAMPNNCVFLVDTYDTLDGVRNAVEVGRWLRENGHQLLGIRLDSGDLTELSKGARKILDEGGFPDARIVASNDLNENIMAELKANGVTITIWGVGTQLSTAYDQPALGGVYKLTMVQDTDGAWNYRIKLSETPVKISNPGYLRIRRFVKDGKLEGDILTEEKDNAQSIDAHDITSPQVVYHMTGTAHDLLVPVFRHGAPVYTSPSVTEIRSHAQAQLAMLPDAIRTLKPSAVYPLGLSPAINRIKQDLMKELETSSR